MALFAPCSARRVHLSDHSRLRRTRRHPGPQAPEIAIGDGRRRVAQQVGDHADVGALALQRSGVSVAKAMGIYALVDGSLRREAGKQVADIALWSRRLRRAYRK